MNKREAPIFVDVALPVPVDRLFTYTVPEDDSDLVQRGARVIVPFGRRRMTGYVMRINENPPEGIKLKGIISVVDRSPLLTEELIALAGWISDYYVHPVGEVLRTMLPASVKGKARKSTDKLPRFPDEELYPELTKDQREAFEKVVSSLKKGSFARYLLYGVTGSGKTEVYLRCIEETLKLGKSAIVLIPEIALIPQTTARFKKRFGSMVEVIHSRLSSARRYEIYRRALEGEVRVVIGPRSAVFAPVSNLGMIVVDEEQDDSFKQQEKPHYNAVKVAEKRVEIEGAVLLLGSATPSLETFFASRKGKVDLLRLTTRPMGIPMPEVSVIDMRGRGEIFSDELLDALGACVERNEKALVLMNRRGHANFIQCRDCGWIAYCPNCSISLTFHSRGHKLLCHYCGHEEPLKEVCPKCGSYKLQHRGFGTQRLEMELMNLVPGARVARMDMDTTRGKGGHERVLEDFINGTKNILLGTQMIAKGHHYPDITLTGVVASDYGLHFPDFRAAERTFRLLYQAAGRTGRGRKGGKVIVQTYAPEHYVFSYLKDHDYEGFAEEELKFREELNYPPAGGLVLLTVVSRVEKRAKEAAEELFESLSGGLGKSIEILGPSPALLARIKGRFRVQILLKGDVTADVKRKIARVSSEILSRRKGTEILWDVDPVDLL